MNALRKKAPARIVALCALAMASTQILALEELLVIGSTADARQLAGSGSVIEEEQLHVEVTTDINQVLKTVPGVYIREEDGSGLRPNIGIRGATSERSGKITLMEDGVLIAPGPYSNPAAYYFPTAMRMSSIEVLKGAPLLRYGPQTTGGVVNLVSTPIPEAAAGKLRVNLDERGSNDLHFNYGEAEGQWGWLVETVQRNSDGFKEIDRSDRDTGFDIEDYMLKVGWQSDGSGLQQRLLLKAQYSEEMSNETYTGLTDADFAENSYRRYGLSEIDQMNNRHNGLNLVYSLDLRDDLTATATGYYNTFARDWFKLGGTDSLIDAANAGDTTAQGLLDGALDASDLRYTHGKRAYESRGVELTFDLTLGQHALAVGGRSHHDINGPLSACRSL